MKPRRLWMAPVLAVAGALGILVLRQGQQKPIARAALSLSQTKSGARGKPSAPAPEAAPPLQSVEEVEADIPSGTSRAAATSGPNWAARPAAEWQGMLINLDFTPPCADSADCGLARACLDHRCVPCEDDEHCGKGESCVLQHCLRSELVECRHASECGPASMCILSGYSEGPRGNESTRAHCMSNFSGASAMKPLK
jgi:hypothetical protein